MHVNQPKNPSVNDFVFSGVQSKKATIEPFNNVNLTLSVMSNFPALDGIGISMVRAEVGVKGSYPMHTHYVAADFLIMVVAELTDGLVINEEVFQKTIRGGDVLCFLKDTCISLSILVPE